MDEINARFWSKLQASKNVHFCMYYSGFRCLHLKAIRLSLYNRGSGASSIETTDSLVIKTSFTGK